MEEDIDGDDDSMLAEAHQSICTYLTATQALASAAKAATKVVTSIQYQYFHIYSFIFLLNRALRYLTCPLRTAFLPSPALALSLLATQNFQSRQVK